jgi:AbrB family transcriptional regulator (stage V sporulation protein T)
MKATGIVRRIDDLGRVVIPKEIRRTLRIREGDPLEIFVDRDGEVILKKYSPIGELSDFAKEYAESLHEVSKHVALVSDRDVFIAVAGAAKREFIDKRIGPAVERAMAERQVIIGQNQQEPLLPADDEGNAHLTVYAIAPIVALGDPIGAVVLCSHEAGASMGETEQKLVSAAASVLGKQMEP